MSPLFDPYFATRRRLKLGLIVASALAGAAFGVALTRLGKLATGAPPADLANYVWNAVFGVVAGVVGPIVTWSSLRQAPLWRTVVEPLAWATAGGAAAVVVGVPVFVLLLPPAGLAVGFLNLRRCYPERSQRIRVDASDEGLERTLTK